MNYWYRKEKIKLKSQNNLNKNLMTDISNIYSTYDCINHISSDYNTYKPEISNNHSNGEWIINPFFSVG